MGELSNNSKGKIIPLSGIAKVAIIIGVSFHLLGFLAFHVQSSSDDKIIFPAPSVQYHSAEVKKNNRLLSEQAELYDSAPLFLPTSWNYASNTDVFTLEVDIAPLFPSYSAEIEISDDTLKPDIRNGNSTIIRARDSLKYKYWDLFSTFGEEKQPENWISGRRAYMEVYDMMGDRLVRSETLPEDLGALNEMPLWTPLEYLVTIDILGALGEPMLLQGSGIEKIDAIMRAYISEPAFGARLEPGYYKVAIGP